jgi:hypothetical protein
VALCNTQSQQQFKQKKMPILSDYINTDAVLDDELREYLSLYDREEDIEEDEEENEFTNEN